MKALKWFAVAALALCAVPLFGSVATAGDHCAPAQAVKVQQVQVQQVVAAPIVVAAPVFVLPSAPTVAIVQQSVFAAPVVVQQQRIVVQQKQVTRSFQRIVTR